MSASMDASRAKDEESSSENSLNRIEPDESSNSSSSSSKKSHSRNTDTKLKAEKCHICEDFASGRHYGVFSCEGCKGFFRRTVLCQLDKSSTQSFINIYHCIDGKKQCVINYQHNRRRCCKWCRFEACLKAGMKADNLIPGPNPRDPSKKRIDEHTPEQQEMFFQLQIYEACEENICLLIKQVFEYLCSVRHAIQPAKSQLDCKSPLQSAQDFCDQRIHFHFTMVVGHLRFLADDILQNFVSSIKSFRSISIPAQSVLVSKSVDQLLIIVLVLLYEKIKPAIMINSNVFDDTKFHQHFCSLHTHLEDLSFKFYDLIDADRIYLPGPDEHLPLSLDDNVYVRAFNRANAVTDAVPQVPIVEVKTEQDGQANDELDYILIQDKKILRLKQKYRYLPLLLVLLVTSIPRNLSAEDKEEIINLRNHVLQLYDCPYLDEDNSLNGFDENLFGSTSKTQADGIFISTCQTILLTNRLSAIFKCRFSL